MSRVVGASAVPIILDFPELQNSPKPRESLAYRLSSPELSIRILVLAPASLPRRLLQLVKFALPFFPSDGTPNNELLRKASVRSGIRKPVRLRLKCARRAVARK